MLALTGQRRVLAHWFTFLVLHLPDAMGSYVFALHGDLAARHADVLAIGSGRTAMAANTTPNWVYFACCAVTVGLSVALIGRWGARSADLSVRDACLRAPERAATIRA